MLIYSLVKKIKIFNYKKKNLIEWKHKRKRMRRKYNHFSPSLQILFLTLLWAWKQTSSIFRGKADQLTNEKDAILQLIYFYKLNFYYRSSLRPEKDKTFRGTPLFCVPMKKVNIFNFKSLIYVMDIEKLGKALVYFTLFIILLMVAIRIYRAWYSFEGIRRSISCFLFGC
jgi:hypothetical protein